MQLTITRRSSSLDPDGPIELQLEGSIDLSTRDALLEAASTALLLSRTLYVDATGVDFIDSVGISALIEVTRIAKNEGGTFELTGRSRALQHALDLVGLGTAWP